MYSVVVNKETLDTLALEVCYQVSKLEALAKLQQTTDSENIDFEAIQSNLKNLASLTEIVSQIRGNVSKAETDLDDAHGNINNLESQLKDSVSELKKDTSASIAELYKIVEEIKGKQQILKEDMEIVNDRPISPDPEEKQGDDPLTPTGQKFATLKDLAANYRLFVNRVEQQLYTIGGGGAGKIYDLDDVVVGSATTNGTMLIYESSTQKWVGIASTAVGGGSAEELAAGATGADLTLSGDLSVGGDLNVTGDLSYDEVTGRNYNITGVATINQGISTNFNVTGVSTINQLQSTNLHVSGISTFVGLATCGILTAYESITIGSTNILTELGNKTSIGLAIALG